MNVQFSTAPPPAIGPAAALATAPPGADTAASSPAAAPPASASAAAPAPQPLSSAVAQQVASQINDFLKTTSSSVEFSVAGDSNKVIVRIVDTQTNQLIRQIPSEQMLAISQALDQMRGVLFNQTAG